MANLYTVVATFKDFKGQTATVKVKNPIGLLNFVSLDDAESFGKGIAKYSRAGLVSVSSVGTRIIDEFPDSFGVATTQAGEHYDLVKQKLVIYYRVSATGRILSIQIPAPNDNCFDEKQEPKGDVLEDVADVIGAATNLTSGSLKPIRGGLRSKLNVMQDFLAKTGV